MGQINRRFWIAITITVTAFAAISVRHVPAGSAAVKETIGFSSSGTVLESGWHFAPRFISRLTFYRVGDAASAFGLPDPLAVVTPQGATLLAEGSLDYRLDAAGVAALHAACSGDPERFLREEVTRALAVAMSDPIHASRDAASTKAVQQAAHMLLAASLTQAGLELRALRLDSLGYQGSASAMPRVVGPPAKVLWLGIDSFDWDVIRPLVAAGRMPNVARLLEEGAWGNLRSITPMLSPVIWTSVATGKTPDKHGILDFIATDPKTGSMLPVTSTLRRSRAFWNILSDAGVSVGVIAWWASFPAEKVNGFMATDRIAYQLFKGRIKDSVSDNPLKTYPADVYPRIASLIRPPEDVAPDALNRFIDMDRYSPRFSEDDWSRVNDFRTLVAATHTYSGIGKALFAERPTDLRVLYFEGPDTAAHLFMPFVPPARKGVNPTMVEWFGRVVPEFYVWQDELIGEFIAAHADSGTTVILSSDHGFRSGEERPDTESRISHGKAADWHDRDGMILMAGPAIKRGARILGASVLDITPTLLALYGLPVGEDMDGKVLTGAFTDEFLAAFPPTTIATYETGAAPATGVAAAGQAGGVDDEEAKELLAKLESLGYVEQNQPTARLNEASILMQNGKFEEAVVEFRVALGAMNNEDGIRLSLARALRMAKHPQEAEAELDILDGKGFKPEAVLTERAALRRETKDWAGAEALLKKALAGNPDYAEAHMHFGRLYEMQDRWEDATASYERATKADPRHGEAFNQLGLALRKLGKTDEAVKVFEQTIQAIPDLPGPYNNLGLIYREKGDLAKARTVLETGVQMAPKSAILRNSLGSLLHDSGRTDEALVQIQKAVENDPTNAESISNLAVLLMGRREPAKAEPLWRRLLEVEPDNRDARVSLAMALVAQGKGEEARTLLQEALKAHPGEPRALVMLGEMALRGGKPADALPLLEQASRVKGAPPRVWNNLARCYLAAKRDQDARVALKRSLALDPNQPDVTRKLAEMGG